MPINSHRSFASKILLSAMTVVAAASSTAHADLTVTALVSVTRSPLPVAKSATHSKAPIQPPINVGSETMTLYFQGDKMAVDVKSGPLIVFNGRHNHAYLVDRQKNSYLVRDISDIPAPTTPEFSLQKEAVSPTTLDGVSAIPYRLTGTISIPQSGPTTVAGELWTSDAVPLPTDNTEIMTALAAQMVTGAEAAQPLLGSQLLAGRDLPLKSTISVTKNAAGPASMRTTTTTFTVLTVSTQDVDASIFTIPDGMQETDASRSDGGTQEANAASGARFQDFGAGGAVGGDPGDMGPDNGPNDGGPPDGGPPDGGPPDGGGGPGGGPAAGGGGGPGGPGGGGPGN